MWSTALKGFALIGAAGFVARRHLEAIASIGGRLVAAHDVRDSVGILDRHFPDAAFFLDVRSFAAFLEAHRDEIDVVSVCTPTYLHEEHCRLACELGADVICEKPLVLDPGGIDRLARVEEETGRRIHPVLQLRYHDAIARMVHAVRERSGRGEHMELRATYITRRGPWYTLSWKTDPSMSGGILLNIGVHVFDLLCWALGPTAVVEAIEVMDLMPDHSEGAIRFQGVTAHWTLSTCADRLPATARAAGAHAHRTFEVNGGVVADYSNDYAALHSAVYREVMAGRGYTLEDARPGILLANRIARAAKTMRDGHPGPVSPGAEHGPWGASRS
jgi:UDP-N-acetyl-2-amino-2-deoxyglucuronate dehydrogenase